jgi:hypothetical protein
MSLDVMLVNDDDCEVFWANITHNLGKMARAADLYYALWRPEELQATRAGQLVVPIREGILRLVDHPSFFKELEPENGWGTYEVFLPWCCRYLEACRKYPTAMVRVSR